MEKKIHRRTLYHVIESLTKKYDGCTDTYRNQSIHYVINRLIDRFHRRDNQLWSYKKTLDGNTIRYILEEIERKENEFWQSYFANECSENYAQCTGQIHLELESQYFPLRNRKVA